MNLKEIMFSFILDSDLQYGKEGKVGPIFGKEDNLDLILENDHDVDFVILAGDLTENGYNGKSFCCYNYGGNTKQLQAFQENYLDPLEQENIVVRLCPGNHDRGRFPYFYQPVFSLLREKYGDIRYRFEYQHFNFICPGIYPNDIPWLEKQLNGDLPNIIFFHYNLEGPFSDWWTEKEKDDFYKTIQDYKIAGILVGHHHISKESSWNDIKTVSAAGNGYARITCDSDRGLISKVEFKKSEIILD